ncbi:MAG: hypothetical protein WBP26_00630 [Candidatus Saccharimonadales bacterium]
MSKKVGLTLIAAVIVFTGMVGFAPQANAASMPCSLRNAGNQYYIGRFAANETYTLNNFCLVSNSGRFQAIFQGDGNFVAYDYGRPMWASGTYGKGAARLVFQSDGNIVIYNTKNQPLWASGTYGNYSNTTGAWLFMQNDGNLVLYPHNYKNVWLAPIWATGTNR